MQFSIYFLVFSVFASLDISGCCFVYGFLLRVNAARAVKALTEKLSVCVCEYLCV